jgi:hypothetical protein
MPEITKISHSLTIGDLKFGNARPGVVEATLKPGETMEQALDELDERLTAWHKKRYAHLYGEVIKETLQGVEHHDIRNQPLPIISKEPEDRRIGVVIADIYSCSDIKTLETYKLISRAKPELQAAYDMHHKKLSNH